MISTQNVAVRQEFSHREANPQIELFESRCRTLVDRVRGGNLQFVDAVDMAASAAEWSGLADAVGFDVVQAVMASAFMGLPRGCAA